MARTARRALRLSFDLDVDICIVGAGLAGLTVALEAARLGASIAVLEGRHVGWNASGHHFGTVMPGFGLPVADLIERVGLEDARELWALSKEGADYVRSHATEDAMPGISLSEGALEVSNVDVGEALISRLQTLSEDFETEVEGWQVDRVRAELRTDRYFHGIHYPKAFQLDGRRYVHGLAALARRAGARIFEDTPVVSIDPSGIRKRIVTPTARLRASHIVLCGNVHLGAPLRRLSETLLPVWRYAAVTEPLGERLADVIAFQGSVMDSDGIDHFRIVDGDRLMWASPETTWDARPKRFASSIQRRIGTVFPRLGKVDIADMFGGAVGPDRARHAAGRPAAQRAVGGERIWPPGHQHLGHGRASGRAQHPLGRRTLAAVLAVRTGLGGRAGRPPRRHMIGMWTRQQFGRSRCAGALPRAGAHQGTPARGAACGGQSPGRGASRAPARRAAVRRRASSPARPPQVHAAGPAARAGRGQGGRGGVASAGSSQESERSAAVPVTSGLRAPYLSANTSARRKPSWTAESCLPRLPACSACCRSAGCAPNRPKLPRNSKSRRPTPNGARN